MLKPKVGRTKLLTFDLILLTLSEAIILEPKQVIAELGISKSQFYRAITKIKKSQKLTVVSRSYMKFELEQKGEVK